MPERNEQLQVTATVFEDSCRRRFDCTQQKCPLRDALEDMLKAGTYGSLDIRTAVELSRLRGLTQAMDTRLIVFNGKGPKEIEGQTLVMRCLQGNVRDGDLETCGTLQFTDVNDVSKNGYIFV